MIREYCLLYARRTYIVFTLGGSGAVFRF